MRVRFGNEVRAAKDAGKPLVALETSVVAQGLPFPQNMEAALACEDAVRRAGATPACIGVIQGEIFVGMERDALMRLAQRQEPLMKIASRDLAVAVATSASGGTTVSATCEVAASCGIRVFATGGMGGVHRGAAEHFDISQDLMALARHPVAVVCAGAKSVLDLPKTLELLESLAVPILGVGTNDLPAFYSRGSGLKLEQRVDDAAAAAAIAHTRFEVLGQGGMVLALPPPEETSLPASEIEAHLSEAMDEARRLDVQGKAVTPFLLEQLARRTAGKSLRANLALLTHNAQFAGEVADAYSRLSSRT